jgi:hypothetical protein
MFFGYVPVIPRGAAVRTPNIIGNLAPWLEKKYRRRKIPVLSANFEVGTNEWPILSSLLKRMNMGDARYDLKHSGKIAKKTRDALAEAWYPSDAGWRAAALKNAEVMFRQLVRYLEK